MNVFKYDFFQCFQIEKIILFNISKGKPGPASSEEERPPTNPVIWIRFRARSKICNVEKGFFSRPWQYTMRLLFVIIRNKTCKNQTMLSTGEMESRFSLTL